MKKLTNCLQCQQPLSGRQIRFCSRQHSQDWYNAQQVWTERPDREYRNAVLRGRRQADPEAYAAKMRKWRAEHPEMQRVIDHRSRIKNAEKIKEQAAKWRNNNRQNLRDRSALIYYQTREKTPWKHILRGRFRDALKRGIEFTLTAEWAERRWTGRCELTDIPFDLTCSTPNFYSPSIDKIDPRGGYTPENCRFILLAINSFKNTATDDDMIRAATALLQKLAPCNE